MKAPKPRKPAETHRPWPNTGDTLASTTFEAVGQALTNWEHLEVQLSLIFAITVVTGASTVDAFQVGIGANAARRAYGSVRTFEGRLAMLIEAVRIVFDSYPDDNLYGHFKKLSGDARRLSGFRHEIAHSIVTNLLEGIPDLPVPSPAYGFVSLPPLTATTWKSPNEIPLFLHSSVEILDFSKQFENLATNTMSFRPYFALHIREHAGKSAPQDPAS